LLNIDRKVTMIHEGASLPHLSDLLISFLIHEGASQSSIPDLLIYFFIPANAAFLFQSTLFLNRVLRVPGLVPKDRRARKRLKPSREIRANRMAIISW
jgi:hypothetical protein